MSASAFSSSANSFWSAITRHQIPGRAVAILDKVLRYSLLRGEFKALIPSQKCLALLCEIDKTNISRTISWLQRAHILSVEDWDPGRGRRPWGLYSLRPPAEWRVPLRVQESARVSELDAWLTRLGVDQGEFLQPPASLNDLLIEDFIECSAPPAAGRVEENPVRPATSGPQADSKVSLQRGGFESARVAPRQNEVPSMGENEVVKNDNLGEQVVKNDNFVQGGKLSKMTTSLALHGTPRHDEVVKNDNLPPVPIYTRARVDLEIDPNRSRSTDLSRSSTSTRSRGEQVVKNDNLLGLEEAQARVEQVQGQRVDSEFRGYVSDRLFRLIGEHERDGSMGEVWRRAIDEIPNQLDRLIATVEAMQRERRLNKTPVRWLNFCVREALGLASKDKKGAA